MTTEERTRALVGPTPEVRTDPGLPPFLEGEVDVCCPSCGSRIRMNILGFRCAHTWHDAPAQATDHPKFEPNLSKADYEAKIRLLEEEVEVLRELLKKRSEEMVEANRRCWCGFR